MHSHSKLLLSNVPFGLPVGVVLNLGRRQIKQITGLMTGHYGLRVHLYRIGAYHSKTVFRLCGMVEETSSKVIFDCEALAKNWSKDFGFQTSGELSLD